MVPLVMPIPSCPGYGATKDGRIWSSLKGNEWRPRHDMPDKDGYRVILLSFGGKRHNRKVHRLVVEAFCGPIPAGMSVNHKDGRKGNNALDNLEVVTRKENIVHAYRTGLLASPGGAFNSAKVACRNGHPFNERNTYFHTNPKTGRQQRQCRECGKNRTAAKRAALKEAE